MAITTRSGKGSPLTNTEMDTNLKQIPNGSSSSITDTGSGIDVTSSSTAGTDIRISNTRNDTSWDTYPDFGALKWYTADGSGAGAGVNASINLKAVDQYGHRADMIFSVPSTSANNVARMTIQGYTGNVGIGTNDPLDVLHVEGGGTDWNAIFKNTTSSGNGVRIQAGNNSGDRILALYDRLGDEKMRVTGDGNVGIGTPSPSVKMHIEGGSSAQLRLSDGSDGWEFRAGTNLLFKDDGVEKMRIDSAGNVGIGTGSSPVDARLLVRSSSDEALTVDRTGSDGAIIRIRNDGTTCGTITISGSSTAYNTSSDYRLKENVVPMTGSIDRLKELKPSRFNFIINADTTVDGFLAHEAGEVVPEAVTGDKDAMTTEEYEVTPAVYETITIPAVEAVEYVENTFDDNGDVLTEGVEAVEAQAESTEEKLVTEAVMGEREVEDMQGIDQSKLVPLLVASLQEAIAKIEELTTRIETLEVN